MVTPQPINVELETLHGHSAVLGTLQEVHAETGHQQLVDVGQVTVFREVDREFVGLGIVLARGDAERVIVHLGKAENFSINETNLEKPFIFTDNCLWQEVTDVFSHFDCKQKIRIG